MRSLLQRVYAPSSQLRPTEGSCGAPGRTGWSCACATRAGYRMRCPRSAHAAIPQSSTRAGTSACHSERVNAVATSHKPHRARHGSQHPKSSTPAVSHTLRRARHSRILQHKTRSGERQSRAAQPNQEQRSPGHLQHLPTATRPWSFSLSVIGVPRFQKKNRKNLYAKAIVGDEKGHNFADKNQGKKKKKWVSRISKK